jgi:hypothetical protein
MKYTFDEVQQVREGATKEIKRAIAISLVAGFISGAMITWIVTGLYFLSLIS